jgi:hypothetical protein
VAVSAFLAFALALVLTVESIGVLVFREQDFITSNIMDKAIKIILAILFFVCLLDMPYGYYQFVRFAGMIGFAFIAYQANQQNKQIEMLIFIGLALLFQPFFKIALGRELWNIVDVIVGVGLLVSVFWKRKPM